MFKPVRLLRVTLWSWTHDTMHFLKRKRLFWGRFLVSPHGFRDFLFPDQGWNSMRPVEES